MNMRPIPWRVRLGLALREMAEELSLQKTKIKTSRLEYPIREWAMEAIMEDDKKRAEEKEERILERWSMFSVPTKPLECEELTLVEPKVFHEAGTITKDAWDKYLNKPKTIYPLKRDPKTGRMMKPERSE